MRGAVRAIMTCLLGASLLTACMQNPCPLPATPSLGSVLLGQVLNRESQPVASAWVAPADATGAPISGMMRSRTDATGRFWAVQVPPGFAYVLLARLPDSNEPAYSGLALPAPKGEFLWELSPASTVVTGVLLEGRVGMPGVFDATVYRQALQAVNGWLRQRPQPVLNDISSLREWLNERQAEDPSLAGWMRQLAAETARAGSREQLETAVAEPRGGPLDAFKPIY
jgi:hypothetical protein